MNNKKMQAIDVYKDKESLNDISLIGNLIFWIDQIKFGKNKRNAIFVKSLEDKQSKPQNLTGEKFFIKNNFHGYGGKAYKCIRFDDKVFLIWIDNISNSLWGQEFLVNKCIDKSFESLYSLNNPIKLTKTLEGNFDSCFEIIKNNVLFGLIEIKNNDYLFSIKTNKENQDLKLLRKFKEFAGSLSSNTNGDFLSWLEWGPTYMPWEKNELYFANITCAGELSLIKKFKNKSINQYKCVSFFQPIWISSNILVCSEDSTGWWNLLFLEIKNVEEIFIKKRIKKQFYEYGTPQWVSGISFFSGSLDNFFCVAKTKYSWILEYYQNLKLKRKIDLDFSNLRQIQASSNRVICLASSKRRNESILHIDLEHINQSIPHEEYSFSNRLISSQYSLAQSFWFEGFMNRNTHAWIYEPKVSSFEKFPLIIKAHSGPTSHFDGSFNSEIQFWTSRGWCVAEVNYGGSSGFGREYRDRLNRLWGIIDSEDCKILAEILIQKQLVDNRKVVICGNSAGGFTAINSLKESNIFKAAICKYPVIDLEEMHANTHRFEKNYLGTLIGDFNCNQNLYTLRSPLHNISKINKPILFFHGKKDYVINYKQTKNFHNIVSKKNYSELYLFEDEGHGFKDMNNKVFVLQKTEIFLRKILNY